MNYGMSSKYTGTYCVRIYLHYILFTSNIFIENDRKTRADILRSDIIEIHVFHEYHKNPQVRYHKLDTYDMIATISIFLMPTCDKVVAIFEE